MSDLIKKQKDFTKKNHGKNGGFIHQTRQKPSWEDVSVLKCWEIHGEIPMVNPHISTIRPHISIISRMFDGRRGTQVSGERKFLGFQELV
jgi:hypothetical protein